jgi:hypothetical protein
VREFIFPKKLAFLQKRFILWKTKKIKGRHMLTTSPDGLSRAFSGAAERLYSINWQSARKEAANFFLDCLKQMPAVDE